MQYFRNPKTELIEKVVSAFCYFTCGLVGLLYTLFGGRYRDSAFFRFHFLQSIILGILSYLLSWTNAILQDILIGIIGLIANLFSPAAYIFTGINAGLGLFVWLISKAAFLLMIYGFIFALLGRYAEIPGISGLVKRQI